ncbi:MULTISPECIES: hypothetical protein [Comamonas]|uniref:hypothetical protein n=1 Tax=Comamonas TaxID=283 RepID=UPI002579F627|nr:MULTISPECIES: hypothetical protein [Comamonas]
MNVEDQQAERAAFEQGFAQASGQPAPAPAAPAAEAQATSQTEQAPAAQTTEQPGEAPGAVSLPAEGAAAPSAEAGPAEGEDPVMLGGYKRSELERLVEQAGKVPELAQQLRKAQGKIGELNSKLQSQAPAQTTTPTQQQVAPELPPELKQFEQDFPEFATYAKALIGTQQQPTPAAPPAPVQQSVATDAAPATAALDPVDIELAVMDRMHAGWREKVQGQEFNTWLSAQSEEVQAAFGTADTADSLAAVIGQFDQWSSAKQARAQKAHKGQQRLAVAVTPQGNAPKPQAAPTETDDFHAGFQSVMGRR